MNDISTNTRFIGESLLEHPRLKCQRPYHRDALGRRHAEDVRLLSLILETELSDGPARSFFFRRHPEDFTLPRPLYLIASIGERREARIAG
jgi:hypothetical protein